MSTTLPDITSKKKRINWKEAAGMRFGRWTVVEWVGMSKVHTSIVQCRCDCGNVKQVDSHYLIKGKSRSCGCLRDDTTVQRSTTHGMGRKGSRHPMFTVYHSMISRCRHHPRYKDRVAVCDRWLYGVDGKSGLSTFVKDMGFPAHPKLTIERVDNDGPYSPENCVWGTRFDQSNNKRNTRFVEFAGRRMSLSRWAIQTGISIKTLSYRFRKKWPVADMLKPRRPKP